MLLNLYRVLDELTVNTVNTAEGWLPKGPCLASSEDGEPLMGG